MEFQRNVFINCPFDQPFKKKYLDPLLFTVLSCDFNPMILQTYDSGDVRLTGIMQLIKGSKYSIHDLSRMVSSAPGEISRFNMPFELGIDIGIRNSGDRLFSEKKCLILDSHEYRYQSALSDISGNDIEVYYEKAQNMARIVRNWLSVQDKSRKAGPKVIWEDYNEFRHQYQKALMQDGFSRQDISNLPRSEFISLAREWIEVRKKR